MNSKEKAGGLSESQMPPASTLPVAPGSLAG